VVAIGTPISMPLGDHFPVFIPICVLIFIHNISTPFLVVDRFKKHCKSATYPGSMEFLVHLIPLVLGSLSICQETSMNSKVRDQGIKSERQLNNIETVKY